jgi:hypothetical protein
MVESKTITVPVRVKLRPKLIRAAYRRVRDLTLELERTEGDLAVAVAEAQRARAELLRALIEQLEYDRKSLYWRQREAEGMHHPSQIEAWLSSLIDAGWAPRPAAPEGEQR